MNWIVPAFVAILACIAGCATTELSGATPYSHPAGSWTLTTIETKPLPDPLPPGLRPVMLTIDADGAVSGNAGINQYSGSVDTGDWPNGEIEFGPMAVTRMAGPPEAMALESRYLGALDAVRTFVVDADALTLLGESGESLLFQRAE